MLERLTGEFMKLRGWVYIITNEAMPGLVKIGYSMKDPLLRALELANTGAPRPYIVAYDVLTFDPRGIEQAAHQRLKDLRSGKEWFRCSIEDAIRIIMDVSESDDESSVLVETRHLEARQVVSTSGADRAAKRKEFYRTFGPGFRPATEDGGKTAERRAVQVVRDDSRSNTKTKWVPPQRNIALSVGRGSNALAEYRCVHCGTQSIVNAGHIAKCDYCGKTGYA